MLSGSYVPNDHVNYVKNPNFWKPGLPYMDGDQLQDHPRRADAHRRPRRPERSTAATVSAGQRPLDQRQPEADGAAQPHGRVPRAPVHDQGRATTSRGPTSASGRRSTSRSTARTSSTRSTAATASTPATSQPATARGRSPQDQLQSNYEKYDLPTAKSLMKQAGSKGFDVTMTTFSTPTDYTAVAALIEERPGADRDQRQHRRRRTRSRSRANNGAGSFDWDLTGRGMRGDVDGYVAEYNPSAAIYSEVVHRLERRSEQQPEADLAARRQRPHHARHQEAAPDVPEPRTRT